MKITIDWQRSDSEIKKLAKNAALPCSEEMAIEAISQPAVIEIDNRVLNCIYNEDPCAYTMLLTEEVGEMLQAFSKLNRREVTTERVDNMVEEIVDTLITMLPALIAFNISGINTTSLIETKLSRLESRFISGNVIFKAGPKKVRSEFYDQQYAIAHGEKNASAIKAIVDAVDGRPLKKLAKDLEKPTAADAKLKEMLAKEFNLPRVFAALGIESKVGTNRHSIDGDMIYPEPTTDAESTNGTDEEVSADDAILKALNERGIAIVEEPEDHSYSILGETQKVPEYFHVLYEYLKGADLQLAAEMVRSMYDGLFPQKPKAFIHVLRKKG